MPGHCHICGRKLKPHDQCEPNDPAKDCGGDCWGCVWQIEHDMGFPGLGPPPDMEMV